MKMHIKFSIKSKQLPVCNSFYIVNHLKDKNFPLKSSFDESSFGQRNKRFVKQNIEIERGMTDYFKSNGNSEDPQIDQFYRLSGLEYQVIT